MNGLYVTLFLNKSELISLNTVKLFQALLIDIKYKFNMNHLFAYSEMISSIAISVQLTLKYHLLTPLKENKVGHLLAKRAIWNII